MKNKILYTLALLPVIYPIGVYLITILQILTK